MTIRRHLHPHFNTTHERWLYASPRHRPLEYIYLVRVKTSITLPEEVLKRIDRYDKNRSALLERAALAYLARLEREARGRKDLEIINRNADRLNEEATDVLGYQKLP